jgi:hypothetical protein
MNWKMKFLLLLFSYLFGSYLFGFETLALSKLTKKLAEQNTTAKVVVIIVVGRIEIKSDCN